MLQQNVICADETTLQVLREEGKAAESKSYMWLYRSGRYDQNIVLFEYQPSRAREHPKEFLKGFQGYLVTDGYAAYSGISPGINNAGCFAHARRGFTDAIKVAGKNKNAKATVCNTPNGAKASAIIYSLVETAKENGLKPFDYLEYLLQEMPNADLTDLNRFMPWSDALPEHCRTPKKN